MRRALLASSRVSLRRSYVVASPLLARAHIPHVRAHLALGNERSPLGSLSCSAFRGFAGAAAGRHSGTMKMWNDEKGFGFITPAEGNEDVFVHRSAVGEGVTVQSDSKVTYEAVWDDRRNKYRAANLELGGEGAGDKVSSMGSSRSSTSMGSARSAPAEPAWTLEKDSPLHVVGGFSDWAPVVDRMAEGSDGLPHYQVKVRSDAPKVGGGNERREEFQIVVDQDWSKRLYPAGGMNEEVVTLIPGKPSTIGLGNGRGHGRNWAVEGTPGTSFQVICDPVAKTVSCELISKFAEKS